MSWISITQDEITSSYTIESSTREGCVTAKEATIYKPATSFKLSNVSGFMFGIGNDFVVKQKYGVFMSVNYMSTSAHEQALISEIYEENQSKFNYVIIRAGVKFGFLRSKSLL